MVLAQKRVSMVEIELVSSRSRRNDSTRSRRKEMVPPHKTSLIVERKLARQCLSRR